MGHKFSIQQRRSCQNLVRADLSRANIEDFSVVAISRTTIFLCFFILILRILRISKGVEVFKRAQKDFPSAN